MLIDLTVSSAFSNDPNATVIVGAGPVGIYLAYCLSQSGVPVVIIEAGGQVVDSTRNQVATNSIGLEFEGHLFGRAFGLGGTSVIWGGQLVEFDAPDFSQWPISFEEVSSWYKKVYSDLSVQPDNIDIYRKRLGGEAFDLQPIERFFTHWLPQQNFARLFRKQVTDGALTQILLNGTVNGVSFEGERASAVKVRTTDGRDLAIGGRRFIFCNGTLEIARFFMSMAKTSDVPWKQNSLVGRFFQDHPCGKAATAEVIDEQKFRNFFETAFTNGAIKLQSKLRFRNGNRKDGDLGVSGFFSFRSDVQDQLGNIKWLIRSLRSGAQFSTLSSLPKDAWTLLRTFVPMMVRFVRDRRVMAFFDRSIDFMIQCEQRPIERSRICLRNEKHPNIPGLFSIDIDWRIDGQEIIETVNRFTREANLYLQKHGLARLDIDARVRSNDVSFLETMSDFYHQAGGMCMSDSPNSGVVDPDCRVWGTSNVYVAGAAVFPSSSHANTTFTALALAARLSSTLQKLDTATVAPLHAETI
jgi:choline dehydrogenase-like flavoprotein